MVLPTCHAPDGRSVRPPNQAILDEDRGWDNFRAQEHDLFLAPDTNAGLLTSNSSGGRVGLLTSQ